jgi:flagellar basal body-associated protein FliL
MSFGTLMLSMLPLVAIIAVFIAAAAGLYYAFTHERKELEANAKASEEKASKMKELSEETERTTEETKTLI